MMRVSFIIIAVLILKLSYSQFCSNSRSFPGYKLDVKPFWNSVVQSLKYCYLKCIRAPCQSFNFHSETKECELLNKYSASLDVNTQWLHVTNINHPCYGCAKCLNNITCTVNHCGDLKAQGNTQSGVYSISPDDLEEFQVWCDLDLDEGYTVFQRRKDGSVDFYRDWEEYKNGFGDIAGEFWLGNDKIHRLTKAGLTSLRIDLEDQDGVKVYANYSSFTVADEAANYRVKINGYSGTAGDSFFQGNHHEADFTTKDRDEDTLTRSNCAVLYHGAWWYTACHRANLNGKYGNNDYSKGINWYSFRGYKYSLKTTEMKFTKS